MYSPSGAAAGLLVTVMSASHVIMLACGFVMLDMVDPSRQTDVARGYSYRQIITRPILGGGFMTALAVPGQPSALRCDA
jgi:hypothetical protein